MGRLSWIIHGDLKATTRIFTRRRRREMRHKRERAVTRVAEAGGCVPGGWQLPEAGRGRELCAVLCSLWRSAALLTP